MFEDQSTLRRRRLNKLVFICGEHPPMVQTGLEEKVVTEKINNMLIVVDDFDFEGMDK